MSDAEFGSADGARSEMDSLNAVGTARYVGQRMGGEGGNMGKGNLDQTLPTGEMAKGNDVKSADGFARDERAEASFVKNKSKMNERGRRG
jgi:hypothetical protein